MKYIENIYLFFRWLFWNIWWYITPRPTDLHEYLKKITKTFWPWYKFQPSIYRNNAGNMYEIWLRNNPSYSCRMIVTIAADIDFNQSGKICSIDLFDEELIKIEQLNALERERFK